MRPVSQSDAVFEKCPSLWHATRIRRLDAGNRFSRIGTACHAACDAVTRAVLGEDGRPLYLVARDAVTAHADAVDLPPDELHEALDVMDGATAADSAISFYVPDGWTATVEVELVLDADFAPLAKCATCGGVGSTDEPLAGRVGLLAPRDYVPTKCAACDGSGWLGTVAYRGRLDRLQWDEETGALEVWDWKTTHDYMSSDDVLLDVQARWYAMLALAWFPAATVVTFKRVMLRLGYTASAKFVRGERWHGQIVDRARRLRKATNNVLECASIAPPGEYAIRENVGSWCGRCPVRGKCLSYAQARTYGAELDMDVPRVAVAQRLGAVKAAAAELDARLREDVTTHGSIPLGDGSALGFFPKRSATLRLPREDVLAELRRMGMTEDQERAWFAPSDRAMPGLVRAALEFLEKDRGMREAAAERVLAPATGFEFTVKEVDQA